MKISHEVILENPEILLCREHRIKERHEFLKFLGKDQYDPKKEFYIAPKNLVACSDSEFVINLAKSNLLAYNKFLKTL